MASAVWGARPPGWLPLLLLLLATGASLLPQPAGCESLRVAGVPIYSGSSQATDEMLDRWTEEFKKRTGMDVDFVDRNNGDVTTDQHKASVLARISDIDVAAVDSIHVGELEAFVLPFNETRLDALRGQLLEDELSSHRTADGRQLAIPWYTDYGLLFYRVDLLDKYNIPRPDAKGWTFDEMEAIARLVQREERAAGNSDFQGFVWPGQSYEGLMCMAVEVVSGHGGKPLVDRDGGIMVDSPGFVEGLRRMSDWIWGPECEKPGPGHAGAAAAGDGSSPPSPTNSSNSSACPEPISTLEVVQFRETDVRRRFCDRGMAMFARHWPSFIADCNSEGMAGNFSVVRMPGSVQGSGRGVLGGQALVVSKHTAHAEAAQLFVELAVSLDWQLQHWKTSHRISIRKDLAVNSSLCAGAKREWCRISLEELTGEEVRLPGYDMSGPVPTVIVSNASGKCKPVDHIASVCDVNATEDYIIARPSLAAGATYASVSHAFQEVIHGALTNVVRGDQVEDWVMRAACAMIEASADAPTPFWSYSSTGGRDLCSFEQRGRCPKGEYDASGDGDCVPCRTLWLSDTWCGDIFVFGGALASLVATAVLVYAFVVHARHKADAIWKVKLMELTFGQPPEVLGRGTFGLVLKAEYRGTTVAVKRVIPPGGSRSFQDFGPLTQNAPTLASLGSVAPGEGLLLPGLGSEGTVGTKSIGSPMLGKRRTLMLYLNPWRNTAAARHANLRQDFIREMRLLSKLRHPCVLTVMGAVISRRSEPMLVMELMEHGALYDLLHNDTVLIEGEMVLPILRDIARGLRFLHAARPGIVHGDLKAQNVLVDSKFRAKVADFGLSQKQKVGACGTPLWMAPELLRGSPMSPASDVYAFGIVLSEVYSRKDPYHGQDVAEVLAAVADPSQIWRPEVPSSCTAEVAVLMRDCWQADPGLRPTCEEIDRRLKSLDATVADPRAPEVQRLVRRKTNDLLYDVFPKHIAEALRNGQKIEPESRDVVTIFFSDIVGFTDISATLQPEKVSLMLDRLYSKFDSLSEEACIFKVETIGDAYMAVSNLVEDQADDHAKRIALFARGAVEAAAQTLIDEDNPSRGCVSIRVGFHSGPVVANVVGTRNLRYCLFGDTVNTAARMESSSERNRVHCSSQAAQHLRQQAPEIPLLARGNISIKGKGDMFTYWVHENEFEETMPPPGSRASSDAHIAPCCG